MTLAIKAENISKAYQLGEIGTGTITRDIERWFAKVRGKEDPFLRIGETNDRTIKGKSDIVWSLKDINFEIQQGDAVGIIGRNGAGKSTLLKVLSRVTAPTSGGVKVKGRIASLLEVGTGFHPELTGRENIYLNGAILGMRKKEIAQKFDEIVDFAGVERYIDTPVKKYSSGMYVRLAFAVAAHLDTEILIVDEVLAVGDAEFQKKCLGKMGEVSKGEGRTILFVSHNMNAISQLCNQGILLNKGKVEVEGKTKECIKTYLQNSNLSESTYWINSDNSYSNPYFVIKRVALVDKNIQVLQERFVDKNSELNILIEGELKDSINALKIGYELFDEDQNILFTSLSTDETPDNWPVLTKGMNCLKTKIPLELLKPGKYIVSIHLSLHAQKWIIDAERQELTVNFEILDTGKGSPYPSNGAGLISVCNKFEIVP
jgi:lipopolysaccharide transport system ATP-binding protein